ncbi:hypothetical protein DPM19_10995 [Actinomadura craniellae]|uniref:Uncharacterized protein n=2 Tax=Actinomadura craniellae TaxID=2231787 RepID=A0A365H892_9ACTN|nr:hypothetical protein DPM19_10995 [Actinomadura craniellae]
MPGRAAGGGYGPPPGAAREHPAGNGYQAVAAPGRSRQGPPPGFGAPRGGPEGPRRRRERNVPLLVGAIGGGILLLVATTVLVISLRADDDGDPGGANRNGTGPAAGSGGDRRVSRAVRTLNATPGMNYTGTLSSAGDDMQVRLSMTKGGSGTGTLTASGRRIDVLVADGATYLRADSAFWRARPGTAATPGDFAGRWTKAPASALGFDLEDALAPAEIGRRLRPARPAARTENINGVPAFRVPTARGDHYFAAAAPHRLLRIRSGTLRVDADPATDMSAVFPELRDRIRRLSGARDPAVRFQAQGKLQFSNCNNNVSGCTLKMTAASLSPGAEGRVRAVMIGTITVGRRALGTCTAGKPLTSTTVDLSCTVRSQGWQTWMQRARTTPGTHRYAAQARVVAEAVSAADVAALLARIDREERGG